METLVVIGFLTFCVTWITFMTAMVYRDHKRRLNQPDSQGEEHRRAA